MTTVRPVAEVTNGYCPNRPSVNYRYGGNWESYVTIAQLLEKETLSRVEVRKNLRGWVTLEAWEIDGARYEIRCTYDDAGNRTSMTYPDGTTVSFEYNLRNQLARIPGFFEGPVAGAWTDNAGFRYDANGFLIGMRSVNGIETTFQPDERNRLKQISSPPLTLTYAYTPGGNVASITDASSGEPFTLTYGYDGANRLISAQVHMPTGIETVQYVYDALGNRIKEAWTDARGAIDYGYLPGNYLVQRGSTIYSWGTYGQLILKDEQPNALGGETNYDYSARRLMTQVRVNGSPVAQFLYDAYGRRVKAVEGDTTTITLYSGNDIVYEIKTQPGQPTVTTKYLAINGKYLAKVGQEGTSQPQAYFYHTDLAGSVWAITDGQGQVVARFEYEPFVVTVQASGPLAGSEVHKFTGEPEDAAIDLYCFNARYYDALVGRFASKDPKRVGLNWYEYARSNPLRYNDPNGCWPSSLHASVAVQIAVQVGFTYEEALIIGDYCKLADGVPVGEIQLWPGPGVGWHFDTDPDPSVDSRLYNADLALRAAQGYIDNGDTISALRWIGFGLHAVGDVSAHANWHPYPFNVHPEQYDDPRFDFDWSGDKQPGSGAPLEFKPGNDRYNQFLEDTRAYLEEAYAIMHPENRRASVRYEILLY